MPQYRRAGGGSRPFKGMQVAAANRTAEDFHERLSRLQLRERDLGSFQSRIVFTEDDRDTVLAHGVLRLKSK